MNKILLVLTILSVCSCSIPTQPVPIPEPDPNEGCVEVFDIGLEVPEGAKPMYSCPGGRWYIYE